MIYDAVIMRTIIELPDEQVTALAELCASENISRAEAIRRAVDALLASQPSKSRAGAFGAWARGARDAQKDSRVFVHALRDEWQR
jgi:metal-responsive CopG/Arc/MetJ family transcriptional regulator